ncbi:hypothetical protein K438DRAFT_1767787 [Mycena galopus ATCC 62051]|nr:hypothetical protein K438DRAFT_1767787 [Mycena galopus ATCC 62051]
MIITLPLPQEALRDPEKWNSDWDALLRKDFALPKGPHLLFRHRVSQIEASPRDLEGSLVNYPGLVSGTCTLQRNITSEALRHFGHDDLEAKWMKAGSDVRRVHILAAMADVCSKARNLNEARSYCPDLALTRLRLDGKVFLNLLKSVMLEDATFIPSQPKFVSHPGWDVWAEAQRKKNDSDAKKIALEEILILRTKLICHVIHFILRSFHGRDPPQLFVKKEHKSVQRPKDSTATVPSELVELLGSEAAMARIKDERAGAKARHSARVTQCSYMNCTKIEEPNGQKFSRCSKCFDKMQRQVRYCSRTCQKADWDLRHKAICGKPLDFETATRSVEHPISASNSETPIGPPVNGYKRSLALTTQVTALNRNPTVDYQLYDVDKDPVNITFGAGQYTQVVFRAHRELAMTEGDRICVVRMAHYLCALVMYNWVNNGPEELRRITPRMVIAQLAREYVFDDLHDAVLAIQLLQNQDPLRRPPLFAEVPDELWARGNQGAKLSEIVVTLEEVDMDRIYRQAVQLAKK